MRDRDLEDACQPLKRAWSAVATVTLYTVVLLYSAKLWLDQLWKATLLSDMRNVYLQQLRGTTRNLVFGGGGYKGLGFVGALKGICQNRTRYWYDLMESVRVCAGSSIGAVAAASVAMGATPWEIENFALRNEYNVAQWGGVQQFAQLSVFDPSVLHRMCRDVVRTFGGNSRLTFSQCHAKFGRHLKIYVANLSKQRVERLDHIRTPHMRVSKALRISCSVPIAFPPVRMGRDDDMYVDGGVFYHSPGAGEFDPKESLFIHLSEPVDTKDSWLSYLHLLYRSTLNASIVLLRERYPITKFCTIRVVSKASMLNMFTRKMAKREVMREGRQAVHAFLRRCDAVTVKIWNFLVQNQFMHCGVDDTDDLLLERW